MKNQDFEGIWKYKLIIPLILIINIVLMFIGPIFIPVLYKYISLLIGFYVCYVTFVGLLILIRANFKAQSIFKKIEKGQYAKIQQTKQRSQINFGFIIPNYKEDIQVLSSTLEVLAKQKRAKQRYLIFLAMEQNQQGSDLKAKELQQKFKNKFKAIQYTVHILKAGEQAGKASNVSWCAEHLQPILEKYNIQQQKMFLTIMDADSWAPQPYFEEVEQNLIQNPEQRYKSIFISPQIYTRNNLQVPALTRVGDSFHAMMHCSTMFSFFKINFPISNYTISYSLLKKIGFWDTCADAIAQDIHITQKAYWNTQSQSIVKPIFVCFNQLNIQTGSGYIENMIARFWQTERHGQACTEMAYFLKRILKEKFRFKNIILFIQLFEILMLQVLGPFPLISYVILQPILPYFLPEQYINHNSTPNLDFALTVILNIVPLLNMLLGLAGDVIKRRSNNKIYKRQNESLWWFIQYQILCPIIVIIIAIPALTIAAFNVLNSNRVYSRADKQIANTFRIEDEETDFLSSSTIESI